MSIASSFDHVNILTPSIEEMTAFYLEVIGLKKGFRPPFDVPGCWLYLDGRALIHLVETNTSSKNIEPAINHFAFAGTNFEKIVTHLDTKNVQYSVSTVPETGWRQVVFRDPDGNKVEILIKV